MVNLDVCVWLFVSIIRSTCIHFTPSCSDPGAGGCRTSPAGSAVSAYAFGSPVGRSLRAGRKGSGSLTRARILLIEDEPLIRELLAEVLLEADFEIMEAGDGEEAVDMLERHDSLDLLLTDVHLPGR